MWQSAGAPAALPGAACVLACTLALAVFWADWRQLRAARPLGDSAVVEVQPGDEAGLAAAGARAAALARLPEVPVFGTADTVAAAPTPTPPTADAELPESTASFAIFGLIEARDPARARAILGVGEAEQREYRVGDALPDGARLHGIRPRALVLDRDGRLELMKLPEPAPEGTAPAVPRRFLPRPVARLAPPATTPDDGELRIPSPDGPPQN